MIRNVILDWSGTVVDDFAAVHDATNLVFGRAGVPALSVDEFRAEFCLPFRKFYERFTPHVTLEQLEVWYHEHFRDGHEKVRLLPHARLFLAFCRRHQLRVFLLSTIHRDHFQAQVRGTDLESWFERCYIEAWDKREKIGELLRENDLRPEETIFAGDMQHDIETGHHGGVVTCAVLTGYSRLEQLRAAEPDLVVEHLGELQDILERSGFDLSPRRHGGEADPLAHPISTVGALIFNPAGQVLMVRTQKWSGRWGIPGGKIKFGEGSEDALRREILEETGLVISDIQFVCVQDCIHSREFYRDAHFLLLNYTCRCGGGTVVLNDEAQEHRWCLPEEALQMELNQPTRHLLEVARAAEH